MLVGVPLRARFELLNLAPLEAEAAATADPVPGRPVTFEGFAECRTPIFFSDATKMIRALQRQPLVVTLYQQHPAAPLPVVVGCARVAVAAEFGGLLGRAARCAARHPLAAAVRGEHAVLDVDGVQVGSASLAARLVCFDGEALDGLHFGEAEAAAAASRARAGSAAASAASTRSTRSGPCTDDKMVTTATDVCTRCMLPRRPAVARGHSSSHHRTLGRPSEAAIPEEAADRVSLGRLRPSRCLASSAGSGPLVEG